MMTVVSTFPNITNTSLHKLTVTHLTESQKLFQTPVNSWNENRWASGRQIITCKWQTEPLHRLIALSIILFPPPSIFSHQANSLAGTIFTQVRNCLLHDTQRSAQCICRILSPQLSVFWLYMRTMQDNSRDLKNPQLKAFLSVAVCSKAWIPSTLHIKRENTPTHTGCLRDSVKWAVEKKEVHSGQDSGGWNSEASGCVFSCTTWREKAQRGKKHKTILLHLIVFCQIHWWHVVACQGSKNQKRSRGWATPCQWRSNVEKFPTEMHLRKSGESKRSQGWTWLTGWRRVFPVRKGLSR